MKKTRFVKKLAKDAGLSPGAAADVVDRVVARIIGNLKRGQKVSVPGLGTFVPGRTVQFQSERRGRKSGK